jgi:hypothetical protein
MNRPLTATIKKVGIMQPYIFPYIGYFQTLKAVDDYVIYDDVQFIKGGWINRNNILIGGNKVLFTVALVNASPNKLINEIQIWDDFSKLIKTIAMAYSKAPYKDQTLSLLNKIVSYPDKNLARFNGNSIVEIAKYLGITTNILYSSALEKDDTLKANSKVVAICKELGGNVYINAIGGQELYDKQDFKEQGIDLKFIKSGNIEYKQFKSGFVPNLSIIDVLMFNSPEEINRLLDDYELI